MNFQWLTTTFDLPLMSVMQGSSSLFVDRFILTLTSPYVWIPLYVALLYMLLRNNKTAAEVALVIGCALLAVGLAFVVTNYVFKPHFMRLRPIYDASLRDTLNIITTKEFGLYSFPSSHACNTMAIAVFFALLVRERVLVTALLVWALTNSYTRIYLGVHFPSDVVAGIIWGAAAGAGVYGLYHFLSRRFVVQTSHISIKYTSSGYAYEDVYVVLIVLILIFFFALFRAIFPI